MNNSRAHKQISFFLFSFIFYLKFYLYILVYTIYILAKLDKEKNYSENLTLIKLKDNGKPKNIIQVLSIWKNYS